MKSMARFILPGALGVLLVSAGAEAQPSPGSNYNVQTMNFDLWCQEEAGLPPDRCDKRLPKDEEVFEAYRAKVEAYEIPYLQRRNEEARINRVLLHNDPIDNPLKNDPARQRQDPNQPPLHSPP
ncbi:MAG: hypothetical protein BGN85_05050 [Alphaproteobacteria bacterium 64-11]|mgnify:CR=1 FL=1|nr:hypothetical protein [Alphaproteobacteria bacterium]OJU09316.1 MAG: hypothetical protein BGN85_05050 [Alphaproteobacteria bacterium 64-11]